MLQYLSQVTENLEVKVIIYKVLALVIFIATWFVPLSVGVWVALEKLGLLPVNYEVRWYRKKP